MIVPGIILKVSNSIVSDSKGIIFFRLLLRFWAIDEFIEASPNNRMKAIDRSHFLTLYFSFFTTKGALSKNLVRSVTNLQIKTGSNSTGIEV